MSMLAFTGADTIKRARRRASHVRTVPHLQPTLLLPPPPPPRPQTLEEEYLSVAFAPPVPAGTAAGGAHALLGSGVDTTTSPLLEAVLHASAHAHAADASLLGAVHRSFAAAPYADRSRACATVDATYSASYGSLPFSLPSAVGPESPAPSQLGSPPAPALATALAHRWWVSPRLNGWLLYSPIIEYRRLGIPSARYQLSFINDTHAFCPSYPDVLALPRGLTPAELEAAAAFRSHRRVPVVVWAHPTAPLAGTAAVPVAAVTGTDAAAGVAVVPISATVRAPNPAVLLRASQPAVGVLGARCAADELLLQACVGLGGVLVVADARRKINALAQFVAKGGYVLSPQLRCFYSARVIPWPYFLSAFSLSLSVPRIVSSRRRTTRQARCDACGLNFSTLATSRPRARRTPRLARLSQRCPILAGFVSHCIPF
jgi:hypothetical protein